MNNWFGLIWLIIVLFTVGFLWSGCAPTIENLGHVKLMDGRFVESIQTSSRGQDGPKVTVIETYLYDGVTSRKVGEYSAGGDGILKGLGQAALGAAGTVGGASVLRPARSFIGNSATTSQDNANTNTNTTDSKSDAKSTSSSK